MNSDLNNTKKKKHLQPKIAAENLQFPQTNMAGQPPEGVMQRLQEYQSQLEKQIEVLQQTQTALALSRDYYVDLYEHSPISYLSVTADELIAECNQKALKLFGMERQRLINSHLSQLIAHQDKDRWHRLFSSFQNPAKDELVEKELEFDLSMIREDGIEIAVHFQCIQLNKSDTPLILRMALTDITARKLIENSLRQQEEFFRFMAENSEDFIAVLDLDGRRLYNNRSYAKLFGDIENLEGTDSFADIHPDDRERVKKAFKETIKSGIGQRSEFRFLLADGAIRYIESSGGLVKNSKSEPSFVVVVSHDITERKRIEDEIQKLAFFDQLTQLPNRRLFNDRMLQTMAASKRSSRFGAVLFLDLDNFKPINDEYGHAVGDLLLIEVANRLKSCVREVDTVSRFGGDEFVVMLNELHADKNKSTIQAEIVAEKIRITLAQPYILKINQDKELAITIEHACTASIGVTLFIDHKISQENILKAADLAMYQSKVAGGNSISFNDLN